MVAVLAPLPLNETQGIVKKRTQLSDSLITASKPPILPAGTTPMLSLVGKTLSEDKQHPILDDKSVFVSSCSVVE